MDGEALMSVAHAASAEIAAKIFFRICSPDWIYRPFLGLPIVRDYIVAGQEGGAPRPLVVA
ncbi:hypothetical protein [Streptomyces sp. NPDC002133]|uniref:hypothetical protein n=1 Tax=Streptomyces sp. NPDC002133 TaxID=3154409 RepID=UPI0033226569